MDMIFELSIPFYVIKVSTTEAAAQNDNKTFRSFKSKENIHKKEVGPYHCFGY